jgi:Fic family protein
MSTDLNRLPDDLPFEQAKERVDEKIRELENDMDRQASTAERMRVARDLLGYFTVAELAGASGVAEQTVRYKITYWISIGAVEAGTPTEEGYVIYGVTPQPT